MSLPIVNYHYLDYGRGYSYHDSRRAYFQELYAEMLAAEPGLSGRVLDIGCGHGANPTLVKIAHRICRLDGVDPFPVVAPHPLIAQRWACRLEDVPVEPNTYDMAYSYNVVEHVEDEASFLAKAVDILKPGGVYWSMSPNARHPFTAAVRLLQATGLKLYYRKVFAPQSNDYPAYYRLCSDTRVLGAIERQSLPVSKVDFYYLHNVQWDTFFPSGFRLLPRLLDRLVILRYPRAANIFMFRIEKSGAPVADSLRSLRKVPAVPDAA